MKRIIEIDRNGKIKNVIAIMSPDNNAMQNLCRSVGFTFFDIESENNVLKAQITL
jgi:hypothetical protein